MPVASTADLTRVDEGRRPGWALTAILSTFAVAKIAIAATSRVVRSPDSRWYEELDWSGRARLPSASLVYALAPSPRVAVVAVAVLSSAALTALALVAGRLVLRLGGTPWLGVAASSLVVVLALSKRFMLWDVVIYSEALTIAATALVVAGVLWFHLSPGSGALVAVGAAALWLASLRELAPLSVAFVLAAIAPMVWAWARGDRRATLAAVAAGLVAVLAAGVLAAYSSRNETGTALGPEAAARYGSDGIGSFPANFVGIYLRRIEPHDDRKQWFVERGMPPMSPQLVEAWTRDSTTPAVWSEHDFLGWAQEHGRETYLRFLLTHPSYALLEPVRSGGLSGVLLPTTGWLGSNVDAFDIGFGVLPPVVDEAIILGGSMWALALVLGLAAGLLARLALLGHPALAWALACLLGWALVISLLTWHGSTIEYERHGVASSFLLLLGLLLVALASIAARRPAPSPTS